MDWFSTWFNTNYYHLLYNNRDESEADAFIDKLIAHLQLPEGNRVLDLACGKGRHSMRMNSIGLNVTGLDLSEASIDFAKKSTKEGLEFGVHDMRDPYPGSPYNFILNAFTSFGYFEDDGDSVKTLNNVTSALEPEGTFVLDFFNSDKVIANLVLSETVYRGSVAFNLKREYVKGFVIKHIDIEDEGQLFSFYEKVRAYTHEEFMSMFEKSGLEVMETWGDYGLNKYEKETSPRMIFKARLSK